MTCAALIGTLESLQPSILIALRFSLTLLPMMFLAHLPFLVRATYSPARNAYQNGVVIGFRLLLERKSDFFEERVSVDVSPASAEATFAECA